MFRIGRRELPKKIGAVTFISLARVKHYAQDWRRIIGKYPLRVSWNRRVGANRTRAWLTRGKVKSQHDRKLAARNTAQKLRRRDVPFRERLRLNWAKSRRGPGSELWHPSPSAPWAPFATPSGRQQPQRAGSATPPDPERGARRTRAFRLIKLCRPIWCGHPKLLMNDITFDMSASFSGGYLLRGRLSRVRIRPKHEKTCFGVQVTGILSNA